MSNRYMCKKPSEVRAAAKGPRKIGKRGSLNRRVVNGIHVTKGRREVPGYDVAATAAGKLYMTFLGH